jgi:hypothetical protein
MCTFTETPRTFFSFKDTAAGAPIIFPKAICFWCIGGLEWRYFPFILPPHPHPALPLPPPTPSFIRKGENWFALLFSMVLRSPQNSRKLFPDQKPEFLEELQLGWGSFILTLENCILKRVGQATPNAYFLLFPCNLGIFLYCTKPWDPYKITEQRSWFLIHSSIFRPPFHIHSISDPYAISFVLNYGKSGICLLFYGKLKDAQTWDFSRPRFFLLHKPYLG